DLPWPRGADALGADERWLDDVGDEAEVRFRGRSLERVSFDAPSTAVENWVASLLPAGPSPGAPNPRARARPLDVVLDFTVSPELVRAGEAVDLDVTLTGSGAVSGLIVEHFVDDVARADETVNAVPLTPAGAN